MPLQEGDMNSRDQQDQVASEETDALQIVLLQFLNDD
jgi:hypothetical protein